MSDTWTPTNALTGVVPVARFWDTAVWTGTQMIVWGGLGQGGSTLLRDGGRYTPGTDTWSATALATAPVARYQHTAVWTGSVMIVWGGWGASSTLRAGSRYSPSANTWTVVFSPILVLARAMARQVT